MFSEYCQACDCKEYCFQQAVCSRAIISEDIEDNVVDDDSLQDEGYFSELIEEEIYQVIPIETLEDEPGKNRTKGSKRLHKNRV